MKGLISGLTAFDLVFPDLVVGENTVLCPFHSEKTPSMQVNTVQKIYHCFGCGAHGTESDFISQFYGVDRDNANIFKDMLLKSDSLIDYEQFSRSDGNYKSNYTYLELKNIGVSEQVLEDLRVGCEVAVNEDPDTGEINFSTNTQSSRLVFPIIMKDRILDRRTYTMDKTVQPKSMSQPGVPAGLILPFHLWEGDCSPTIVCEGEKDMAMARTYGYNAISLGGANNLPSKMLNFFKDRKVYIVYDNDAAGKSGALKLASTLFSVTKNVYIADIGKYAVENKEDITDFFTKYKYGNAEFDQMLTDAKLFDVEAQDAYIKTSYPEVSLNEASTTYLGKTVRSNVQVMATYEDQYSVPSYAVFSKVDVGGKEEYNRRHKGDTAYWSLTKNNFEDVLILTDNQLKKNQINDNLKMLVGWGEEEYVSVNTSLPKTVFKACVADCTESIVAHDIKRTEFTCYTSTKLDAGKNYQIIYKVVPHPYKGQQQVLIVLDVKESNDVVTSFTVTSEARSDLAAFQNLGFKTLVEKQKAYVKFDVDNRLLSLIDLWYHTPKEFDFGFMKGLKGYLDGLIVTESRVGKSSTSQALSRVYGLGAIASLAGSAATPAGLIGGSVKSGSSSQIRPGLIPRNHNRAVIFEELAKAKYTLMPELTDIRSSGLVRINRSTGDLTLPASVRMLFLSNPKTDEDDIVRPILAYPNGIEIIKPLVGAVEDIARFDFIYILGESPKDIDPVWTPPEGFTEKQLKTRIRWIWSRKCDQIKISSDVQKYIVQVSKELNDKYMCSVKIFSTETWKKLARMSIAIAGYMVSTDATYENIIVTEKHVNIAKLLLTSLYDNAIFKLKEFVGEERKRLDCTVQDIANAKEMLTRYPAMMRYLENNSNVAKNTLMTVSGLDINIFNEAIKRLSGDAFITLTQFKIFPTPKLLIALKRVQETNNGAV